MLILAESAEVKYNGTVRMVVGVMLDVHPSHRLLPGLGRSGALLIDGES